MTTIYKQIHFLTGNHHYITDYGLTLSNSLMDIYFMDVTTCIKHNQISHFIYKILVPLPNNIVMEILHHNKNYDITFLTKVNNHQIHIDPTNNFNDVKSLSNFLSSYLSPDKIKETLHYISLYL